MYVPLLVPKPAASRPCGVNRVSASLRLAPVIGFCSSTPLTYRLPSGPAVADDVFAVAGAVAGSWAARPPLPMSRSGLPSARISNALWIGRWLTER
jgi:hypothetical protein